jgi:hypothetical protein
MKRMLCLVLALAALVGPLPSHAGSVHASSVLQGGISGTVSYLGGGGAAGVGVVCWDAIIGPVGQQWSATTDGAGNYSLPGPAQPPIPCGRTYDVTLVGGTVPGYN